MKFDLLKLESELARCTTRGQTLFALLCSERARSCCWAFQKECGRDFRIHFEALDAIFSWIGDPTDDRNFIGSMIRKLEDAIPTSEEFGSELACQGRNAMISLLYAAEVCFGDAQHGAANAAKAAVEIVDACRAYEAFSTRVVLGLKPPISAEFAVLDSEISYQSDDLRFIERQENFDMRFLALRRKLNQVRSLPIAVW